MPPIRTIAFVAGITALSWFGLPLMLLAVDASVRPCAYFTCTK